MSDKETVIALVESVEVKDNGWTEVKAAGRKFATKLPHLSNAARAAQGQTVEITFTTKVNGTYTNYYLDKIGPAPEGSAAAAGNQVASAPAGGGADDDRKWREKERRDLRSRAWAQASSTLAQIGALKPDMTAKDIHDRVAPLAGAIFLSVAGPEFAANTLPGAGPDDTIPFGPSWA